MSYLDNLTKEQILSQPLPIGQILENSLYYPACGFDGGVIKDCNQNVDCNIRSFVYADYAAGEEAFLKKYEKFTGYSVLASRSVHQHELIPNGWQMTLPPKFNVQQYFKFKDVWKPFCRWTVYSRTEGFDDSHGPERFSLLYIGGEACATYQALYWSNKIAATALALIQPGTAWGFNWTDFRSEDGPLAWVIQENPVGLIPMTVFYGGISEEYDDFKWGSYAQERDIRPYYTYNNEHYGLVKVFRRTT